ncbi:MAG TPA: hypothetical protein CFH84_08960 [Sulfurimonas sp. UBA12504]|nr:MAG: hypothetical protein A2019_00725 [Sulfurimonas sp. GWF2_37_8]DAB29536.1 MAG TPA: hypothetical protein CFH84_08960 [Sulfurimonas sp. UBA12504]
MVAMPVNTNFSHAKQALTNEIVTPEMSEIKIMIAQTVAQRNSLKTQMQEWYDEHPREHFPSMQDLMLVDATLSKLDSFYKRLWDYNNLQKM